MEYFIETDNFASENLKDDYQFWESQLGKAFSDLINNGIRVGLISSDFYDVARSIMREDKYDGPFIFCVKDSLEELINSGECGFDYIEGGMLKKTKITRNELKDLITRIFRKHKIAIRISEYGFVINLDYDFKDFCSLAYIISKTTTTEHYLFDVIANGDEIELINGSVDHLVVRFICSWLEESFFSINDGIKSIPSNKDEEYLNYRQSTVDIIFKTKEKEFRETISEVLIEEDWDDYEFAFVPEDKKGEVMDNINWKEIYNIVHKYISDELLEKKLKTSVD